ncbi:SDR family NAD(P)-dependent oxidoreductase [Aeromicrobium ginsengisoli]|uniref:SDR family oxidoreductase n=1 Tax=Aeromicrobium ginsengisoli TaxID=363867 RepID=A0A5M4F9L5_9ACTN|nr:SDR family oxidoreductase [Aeromicrobium ginsengisoli]KAA1394460.1 SDR family oxidoreductase [Aeromicrobium ginsengisoli]
MARVAVVTGASRGVGAAVALGLAQDGHDVVVAYRRDHDAAREVVAAIEAIGRRAVAVAASLADPDGPATIASTAIDTFGRVDTLAHCAGVACPGADVVDTPVAEFERQLAVHLYGPLRLTQALVPHLREQERSAVVFVSSAVTDHMRGLGSPYNVGKAAMEALARTLANEERYHGVRVNIVAPGLVDTELGRRFIRAAHGRDIHDLAPLLPFGSVCAPEDVAAVVRFLASEGAAHLSGVRLPVNGGDDDVSSNVAATRVALDELADGPRVGP